MALKKNMTVANLWLVFKIVGFALWAIVFLVISFVLFLLWEQFNDQIFRFCNKNINNKRSFWSIFRISISVRINIYPMSNFMEVLFRYLVFDDFGDPHKRFRTKHEAEMYIVNRPNHTIKRLPAPPKENVFDLIKDEPLF